MEDASFLVRKIDGAQSSVAQNAEGKPEGGGTGGTVNRIEEREINKSKTNVFEKPTQATFRPTAGLTWNEFEPLNANQNIDPDHELLIKSIKGAR